MEVTHVLAEECGLVSAVAVGLSEEEFALPTRCPPWDVKVLLGHMWRDMDRIAEYVAEPAPEEAETDAVTYWRSYNPTGDAALISARSYEVADRFASGRDLAESFDARRRDCIVAAQREDPERLIRTRITTMRLDQFLSTRVLEIAVHGLDLADALGREPWITLDGSRVTREILTGLLEREPPSSLGWDDVTFIESGTGRRELTDSERSILGDAAGRFPLLG